MNSAIDRYDDIFNHLMNLAINRFTWGNLPLGLTSEQLEKLLIEKGVLMGYKSKYGLVILPCFGENKINIYGLPTHYRTMSVNGIMEDLVDIKDGVLLKNNPTSTGDYNLISNYATLLNDIQMTQDVNLFQQNIPKIIITENGSELTAKNIINKLRQFKLFIFARKSITSQIKVEDVLDTSSPYLLDKLTDFEKEKYNQILTRLGINNANTDKKERLITDEVNANNDLINVNLDLMFDVRKKFTEEFNSKFGTNVTVEKREVNLNDDRANDDNSLSNDNRG